MQKPMTTHRVVRQFYEVFSVAIPKDAELRRWKGTDHLVFNRPIAGASFVEVQVGPASAEMRGTAVKVELTLMEKRHPDGRRYRYIDADTTIEAEEGEPVHWFWVVPNRADEIELKEGWTFFNVPHPKVQEATLRGSIILCPAGHRVTLKPVEARPMQTVVSEPVAPAAVAEIPTEAPAEVATTTEAEASAPVAEAPEPVVESAPAAPKAAAPETPAPAAEATPAKPRKPRTSRTRAKASAKAVAETATPAVEAPKERASAESIAALAAHMNGGGALRPFPTPRRNPATTGTDELPAAAD